MARSGAARWNQRSLPPAAQPAQRREETQSLRVFNRSRGSLLSLEGRIIDTAAEPLKKLIEELAARSDVCLWLTPYRGIPTAPGFPQFDLVYLDEERRVIREVESYPSPNVKFSTVQASSVLVLPSRTLFASQIHSGDQLAVCVPQEMNRQLRLLMGPTSAHPAAAQSGRSREQEYSLKGHLPPALVDGRREELRLALQHLGDTQAAPPLPKNKSLMSRVLRSIFPDPDSRGATRHALPGLVAYHWTGGTPKAYQLENISETGFFLLTEERPYPGTLILMTLQRTRTDGTNPGDSIAVQTKVVRWANQGVGLAFVLSRSAHTKVTDGRTENGADQKSFQEFLKKLNLLT